MEGKATIAGAELEKGDYLYTPPNFKHSVKSENGCMIMFVVPKKWRSFNLINYFIIKARDENYITGFIVVYLFLEQSVVQRS